MRDPSLRWNSAVEAMGRNSMSLARTTPGFRRYFANTSWLLAERASRFVALVFVGVYVARYLGPQQFGVLSFAASFVGLFGFLSTLGLNQIVVRDIVGKPDQAGEVLGAALFLKIFGAVIAVGAILSTSVLVADQDVERGLIGIMSLAFLFQVADVIELHFQARVESKYVAWARFLQTAIGVSLRLLLIAWNADLIFFAWVMVAEAAALAVGLGIAYGRVRGWSVKWGFQTRVVGRVVRDSWVLIVAAIAMSIFMRADKVMIGLFLSPEAVGLYAAASKLTEAWYFVPVAVSSGLFPAIINARKRDVALYRLRVQRLYELMLWLSVGVAVPLSVFSGPIITLLYGEAYRDAAGVLALHVWVAVFVFLNNASWRWYVAENKQGLALIRLLIGLLINLGLNVVLIPAYGPTGAAAATLVAWVVAAYLGHAVAAGTRENFYLMSRAIWRVATLRLPPLRA